jgi:plastocyanin
MTMNIRLPVRGAILAMAALLAMSWIVVSARPVAQASAITHRVVIDGSQFVPRTLTVKAGDSIEWVNEDPFPHTATSKTGRFDSHEIASKRSWTYKAAAKGEFAYVCDLHRTMTGTLRVQ